MSQEDTARHTIVNQIVISDKSFLKVDVPRSNNSVHQFADSNTSSKIWSNEQISRFIEDNFEEEVFQAYKSIKPYAYKADLARYCIIFINGGWYMDINNRFISNIPVFDNNDLCLFRDIPETGEKAIQNGLFYAKKNNAVIKKTIDICVDNILNEYYGDTHFDVTGPTVMGKALEECGVSETHLVGNFVANSEASFDYILPDGTILAKYKSYGSQRKKSVAGGNTYWQMWQNKEIY